MITPLNITYESIIQEHEQLIYKIFCDIHPELTDIKDMEMNQQEEIIKLQFQIRQGQLRQIYPKADYRLILFDGIPVGCLYTDIGSDIRIIEIGLLKKYRGIGIGSLIMKELIDKANALCKNITLQVLWFNRSAYQFYKKLGFQEIDNNGIAYEMKYNCSTGLVN